MKKILHLSADEKFIDMGLNAFEMAYPKKNSLLLVQKHNTIKHVKFENKKIINKQTLDKASRKSEFWTDVDVVVFHSLFVYKVKGSGLFDGSLVKLVMTNGKLSDYAIGSLEGGNILSILFTDNSGYIYKLNK